MRCISCAAVMVLFAFAGTVCEGAAKGTGGAGGGSRPSGGMSGGSRPSGGMSGGSKPSYPSGGTSRPSHPEGGSTYRPPVRITIPVPVPVPIGGSYPQRQPYYPQQPQYQPEYPDSTPRSTAPPKNTVIKEIKDPPSNKGLGELVKKGLLKIGNDETDAQQAFESDKFAGLVDDEITKLVGGLGDAGLKDAWAGVLKKGAFPDVVAGFKNDQKGKFKDPFVLDLLGVRELLSQHIVNLEKGVGQADSLAALRVEFKKFKGGSPLGKNAQQTLAILDRLNALGRLAGLAVGMDDPLDILLRGARDGGFSCTLVGDMCGLPIMPIDPCSDAKVAAPLVYLYNPPETKQPVGYTLNDEYQYTMQCDNSQVLDTTYTITFDSGGSGGTKTYSLEAGSYKWVKGKDGWDLNKATFEVILDNSAYSAPFCYVLGNDEVTLKPGEKAKYTHIYPIDLTFDRGDEKAAAHKMLKSGTYVVGVDASKHRLDLFPQGEKPLPKPQLTLTRAERVQLALKKSPRNLDLTRLAQEGSGVAPPDAVPASTVSAAPSEGDKKAEVEKLLRELKGGAGAAPNPASPPSSGSNSTSPPPSPPPGIGNKPASGGTPDAASPAADPGSP